MPRLGGWLCGRAAAANLDVHPGRATNKSNIQPAPLEQYHRQDVPRRPLAHPASPPIGPPAYRPSVPVPGSIRRSTWTNGTITLIRRYQTEVSAHRPAICRYRPTCSNYGIAALQTYGLVRGLWLTGRRLARCRGSVRWGTPDPVPPLASWTASGPAADGRVRGRRA